MNTIIINGKSYKTSGSNITVNNGIVYVGGNKIEDGLSGVVEIKFTGDLASLKTDGSATIDGNVSGNVDTGGSVTCGDVDGDIDAGGSVSCGNVVGNIDAGGSVKVTKW